MYTYRIRIGKMAKSQTSLDEELEKLENHTADDESAEPVNYTIPSTKSNLQGDWLNFFLLLLLYTIQGLPLGFAVALPIIFQSKRVVTYREQVSLNIYYYYVQTEHLRFLLFENEHVSHKYNIQLNYEM